MLELRYSAFERFMANIFIQPCDEGAITSGANQQNCAEKSEPWILAATILGSSMAFIDGTVVNVALPALQSNLNATVLDVQWVVESYALLLAALLLVGGSLGDRYGRRRVFCAGTALFALASIWCGASPNVSQLIFARAVQGVGGALLVPGSLAIISSSFGKDKRAQAIGTWSGFTAITTAVGPVLGGWLIEHISWRAAFYINLPLAIVVIFISYFHVPENRGESKAKRLDFAGAALATAGLGSLVYGLIESSRLGFGNPLVIITLAAGILFLAFFIFNESRSKEPMLPLRLFASKTFAGANLLTLFLYTGLAGSMFFVPLNLIQVQGYTATAAGAAWLPFILLMFLLSRWSGGVIKRYGAKLPLTVGPAITAAGYSLFAIGNVDASYWKSYFPAIVVLGLGMAISVAPLTATVMGAVPENRAGLASGANNAISRIAGLLGIAVFGIIMLSSFTSDLTRRMSQQQIPNETQAQIYNQRVRLAGIEPPASLDQQSQALVRRDVDDSFIHGFKTVMFTAAGLSLAAALSALMMIEGKTKIGQSETAGKQRASAAH